MSSARRKVWFYRPEWYWHGWDSLLPIHRGHDEYARYTIVLGWPVTGRAILALRYCGDRDCIRHAIKWRELEED